MASVQPVTRTAAGPVTESNPPRFANFVIGGTEKAGTTSVFDYLSAHPQVGTSAKKETDFFREGFTGDLSADALRYAKFFERCDPHVAVLLEASPGYLGEAASVAPRMRALAPATRLLFILRDPIDRLYSSYHFHRGKLNLPQELSFEDYVKRCLAFDRGTQSAQQLGIDAWYLKVLRFGCYSESIAIFREQLRHENIKIMFFEALGQDERAFMVELSAYLGIDAGFWSDFEFRRSNVTFSGRNKSLHRLVMWMNGVAEPLMRRYPGLKQSLVRAYKSVNQEREGYDPMSPAVRQMLIEYYGPGVRTLQQQLGAPLPPSWQYLTQPTAAA